MSALCIQIPNQSYMLKNLFFLLASLFFFPYLTFSQPCTPQGDQSTYGTNDTWIGYVYDNLDFTNYKGYITQGSPGNLNFDQAFGGATVNFSTNDCSIFTDGFSIRYKLVKTFAPGDYDFTIAGDDAYRLSLDGGVTWIINNWSYLGYNVNTVTLSLGGTYNMVLEYYENVHNNRIAFNVSSACLGSENTSIYGVDNVWRGYVYNGMGFEYFKGIKNEGSAASADFDQDFGGNYARFNTSTCQLLSEHFSIRYRLTKTFTSNNYSFIVSSEDGYRLSLDGGNTWLIDNWSNNTFSATDTMINLDGTYNMVLEYHENTGANRIGFSVGAAITLPLEFISFTGRVTNGGIQLQWQVSGAEENEHFEIERSKDGMTYQRVGVVQSTPGNNNRYLFTDETQPQGELHYRIKAIDAAGRVRYSRPITLLQAGKGIRIYPTYVNNGAIYISNDKSLSSPTVLITDMAGRPVNRYQLSNLAAGQTTSLYIPEQKLLKGIYLVQLIDAGQLMKTERIIIQ